MSKKQSELTFGDLTENLGYVKVYPNIIKIKTYCFSYKIKFIILIKILC